MNELINQVGSISFGGLKFKPEEKLVQVKTQVYLDSKALIKKLEGFTNAQGWISFQSATYVIDQNFDWAVAESKGGSVLWAELSSGSESVQIRRSGGNWLFTEVTEGVGDKVLTSKSSTKSILGDHINIVHDIYWTHSDEFGWRPWCSRFVCLEKNS